MKLLLVPVVLLVACGSKTPAPAGGTMAPEGVTTIPPELAPNGANLNLQCDIRQGRTRANPCDAIPHKLEVPGNKLESCYRTSAGRFKLELKSSGDPKDTIVVNIENYAGPNTYNLDEFAKNEIRVSGSEMVPTCVNNSPTGPAAAMGVTAQSPGNDRWCTSSGCTFKIEATDAATPDRFKLTVDCPELCETNSDLVCMASGGGRVQFEMTQDCPVSN